MRPKIEARAVWRSENNAIKDQPDVEIVIVANGSAFDPASQVIAKIPTEFTHLAEHIVTQLNKPTFLKKVTP